MRVKEYFELSVFCILVFAFAWGVNALTRNMNYHEKKLENEKLAKKYIDYRLGIIDDMDTYGTRFRFIEHTDTVICISAGRDLEFGTNDDIVVQKKQ